MSKLSVIIPSRGERFLAQTVADVFAKARGDIEVIVALDGYWPEHPLPDYPNLKIVHFGEARGMRAGINAAAGIAKGEWLMKCDAHCMFAEGFDEVLKADCADNWIVIPRRYSLDAENWCYLDKTPVDYHRLDCPMTNPDFFQFHGMVWRERANERRDNPAYDIDETMSFQGSLWFMSYNHWRRLGPMSEVGYGTFSQEPQEIGNKTWLSGGALMVNKKTSYAHLHKGKQYGRGYYIGKNEVQVGHLYSAEYWMSNSWSERTHDIEWLIEKFMPIPGWPENWHELLENWQREYAKRLPNLSR
jgi:glycosyltransferase involved in cell wall biosynthesis